MRQDTKPTPNGTSLEEYRAALLRSAFILTRDTSRAEDLVQRTFERALVRSTDLDALDNPLGWLRTVMKNLFIDEQRRAATLQRVKNQTAEHARIAPSAAPRPVGSLRVELERALATIPREQAQALLLVVVEGFTYAEVADAQGVAVGTVKSRVARGREALAAHLRPRIGSGQEEER